jgi:hypothetical protein
MGKNKPLRVIDQRPALPTGGIVPQAPPAPSERITSRPQAPIGLNLSTGIERIGPTYLSYVSATWFPSSAYEPESYDVEFTRPEGVELYNVVHDSGAVVDGLPQTKSISSLRDGTTYSVRVRSIARGGAVSDWTAQASITTAADTTPPANVTSLAADFTGTDCILSWQNPDDADLNDCIVDIYNDSSEITLHGSYAVSATPGSVTRWAWTLAENRRATSNAPDPTVYVEVRARDYKGNLSGAVSVIAINAAPAAPSGVTLLGYVSTLAASVIGTRPPDFLTYRYRVIRDGATQSTSDSADPLQLIGASVKGSYQVGVRVVDVFGQESAETVSSAVTLDFITIEELRALAQYADGNGVLLSAADQARLKDGLNTTFVPYVRTQWNVTEQFRPFIDRYQRVQVGFNADVFVAVGISTDRVNWKYHHTPAADGVTFTAITSDLLTALGGGAVVLGGQIVTLNLATFEEARYIRIFHYYGGAAQFYGLGEFYARRLVQTDDLDVEAVRAINVAAGAIVADKIAAGAITATKIAADAVTANAIAAGAITAQILEGDTIQTAASGARTIMDATGIRGTNGSTTQWQASNATGALTAGAGTTILDATGISKRVPTGPTFANLHAYRFEADVVSPYLIGGMGAYWTTLQNVVEVTARSGGGRNGALVLNGNTIEASTTISQPSDARSKVVHGDLPFDALAQLLALRAVAYHYHSDDAETTRYGFVAQEVADVLPDIIDARGEQLAMRYPELIAVLVRAVQQLAARVTALELARGGDAAPDALAA